jgi:hypothetical protein
MLLLVLGFLLLGIGKAPKVATAKPAVKPAKLRPLAPLVLSAQPSPPPRVKVETSPELPPNLPGGRKKMTAVIGR